jgi:O-phosphoseryl-tRNA(Sec) kinase
MNQFILALCGLPASGKSTLANAIQRYIGSRVSIVRTDEWRDSAYYTQWDPDKEGAVRTSALARVQQLIREGESVIHDDTNYYNSMRHELLDIAIESKSVFGVVYVSTPLETALQWNKEREGTRVTDNMITKIHERFDTPGGRYLWDYPLAEVNMSKDNPDQEAATISEILEDLEPQREPKITRLTPNDGDLLDQVTREVVSKFLAENPHLRQNKEVFLIRRTILRKSIEDGVPPRGAASMLRAELDELL